MKKIKILALLAIVVFLVQDMGDMFQGFADGWEAAGDRTEFKSSMSLAVRPTATLVPDTCKMRQPAERLLSGLPR